MALNLEVNILGEFKNLTKATRGATKQLQGLQTSARSIARGINTAFAAIGVGVSLNAISGAIRGAVREASNLEESVNAVRVAFGPAAEEVLKLGDNSAKSFGLARSEFNSAAVRFSAFASVLAKGGQSSADVVEQLTTRAADFASVFNIEVDEALRVFQSGLAGESEPLRRFGVILTDTEVKAFAYANGIAEVGTELDATQKTQARYGLLLRQTDKVQGDFANTSGSMANALRIMRAGFQDASASIGNGFTPAIAAAAGFISSNIATFDALGEAIGTRLKAAFETTGGAANNFGTAIITTLTDLTEFLNGTADADNAFVKLQENIGPTIEILGGFGEVIKGLIAVLDGVFAGLFGWLSLFRPAGQEVNGFASFLTVLGEGLQQIGFFLGFVFSLFVPFTTGFKIAAGVLGFFSKTIQGLLKAMGSFGKGIQKFFDDIFGKSTTKIKNAENAILDAGDATRTVTGGFKEADAAASAALKSVTNYDKTVLRIKNGVEAIGPAFKVVDKAAGQTRTITGGILADLNRLNGKPFEATVNVKVGIDRSRPQLTDLLFPKRGAAGSNSGETNRFNNLRPVIAPIGGGTGGTGAGGVTPEKGEDPAVTLFKRKVQNIVDKLRDALVDARERLRNSIENFRDSVQLSFGIITNGAFATFDVNRIIRQMNRIKSAAKTFADDIKSLQAQGADQSLIDQLLGMDPISGATAARGLLSSGRLAEFLGLRSELAGIGGAAGEAANVGINGTSTSGLAQAIIKLTGVIDKGAGNTYNINLANTSKLTAQEIIAAIKSYEKTTGTKVFSK